MKKKILGTIIIILIGVLIYLLNYDYISAQQKLNEINEETVLKTKVIESNSKINLLIKENKLWKLQLTNSSIPSEVVSTITIIELLNNLINNDKVPERLREFAKLLVDDFRSGNRLDINGFINEIAVSCAGSMDVEVFNERMREMEESTCKIISEISQKLVECERKYNLVERKLQNHQSKPVVGEISPRIPLMKIDMNSLRDRLSKSITNTPISRTPTLKSKKFLNPRDFD